MMGCCATRSRRKGLRVGQAGDSADFATHWFYGDAGLGGGDAWLESRRVGRRRDAGENREAEDFGMTAEAKLANALEPLEVGLGKLDSNGFHGLGEAA